MSHLDFRKETERKLWIFLVALSAFLLFILVWGAVENAVGVTVKTSEITNSDDWGSSTQPQRVVARGPDNIIRHVYPSATATSVNLSYSSDNGTSWTETTIFNAGYDGATEVLVRGIVCTSNNTTIVLLTTTGATHTYDVYLLIRWGWFGSWEINQGWGQNSYSYGQAQIAINDTNIVLIMFQYNMVPTYGFYRPNLHSFLPAATSSPTTWNQGGGVNIFPFIEANLTGKFWASFIGWDGSNYCIYYRDICATKALMKQTISNLMSCYILGMECIPVTGDMIFSVACNYSALNYHYIYFYYHRNNKAYFQGPGMLTSFTSDIVKFETMGMTVDATGMVEIWWYSETNHKVCGMRCLYTDPLSEWTSSIYDVRTGYTSTDYINIGCGVSSMWPQIIGVSVNIPKTGYFQNWIWKDEVGATDDYHYQLIFSCTWPYIFWVPPVITNYSLPNWYESEPYLHDFTISSGNTPYVWWITWNTPSDGGWFLGDSNGTMYGYCPATNGTYSITVHVTDFYGLTTTRTTSLTILSRSTGGGTGGTSVSWDWPTLPEQGVLWILLVVVSMFSCLFGLTKRWAYSFKKKRG